MTNYHPPNDSFDESMQDPGEPSEIRLRDYWNILVERRAVALGCFALIVAATMIATLLRTPEYSATTTIEIERQGPEILEFTDVVGVDPAGYRNFYETQYKIIRSRAVLRIAAQRYDLANVPEYVNRPHPPIARLVTWGKSLLGGGSAPETDDPVDTAVDFLEKAVAVAPVRNSHLVLVTVADRDPDLAADLANAVAEAYQQFQLDSRYTTTGKAKEFLAKDVARYQSEISALQRKLQEYGADQEILGLHDDSQDISEQALGDMNTRVIKARSELAAAESRYEAVRDAPDQALPDVLNNSTLNQLRQETAILERRASQLREQFNDDWPALREVLREYATAQDQIASETAAIAARVRAAAEAEYRRAKAEADTLARERDVQKVEVQRVNMAAIEYRSLREEIATKQQVLHDLVARKSETETSYRLKETATSNIRIVDRADTPADPSSPKKLLNLLVSMLLGAGVGFGAAFLSHHLDNTIKSEQEVVAIGRVTVLGHVPLATSLELATDSATIRNPTNRLDWASFSQPRSAFSEAFRDLRTSLLIATPDHPPRHIAVTSCEPGDGKSTIAVNLAIVLTQLGRRVLIVDADLRRPRLHVALGVDNSTGLSTLLSGNAEMDDVVRETSASSLQAITSGPVPPNPAELLESPRLQTLLAGEASLGRYDHIILDCPPVMSVTDAVIIATKVDATALVVRSGVTSRDALRQSVDRLRQARSRVIGSILNAVSGQSTYYYRQYGHYSQKTDEKAPVARWRHPFGSRDRRRSSDTRRNVG